MFVYYCLHTSSSLPPNHHLTLPLSTSPKTPPGTTRRLLGLCLLRQRALLWRRPKHEQRLRPLCELRRRQPLQIHPLRPVLWRRPVLHPHLRGPVVRQPHRRPLLRPVRHGRVRQLGHHQLPGPGPVRLQRGRVRQQQHLGRHDDHQEGEQQQHEREQHRPADERRERNVVGARVDRDDVVKERRRSGVQLRDGARCRGCLRRRRRHASLRWRSRFAHQCRT
ncbi:hypothetical protein DFJ73DRAFT_531256 [Zopfochytrium polystomum]|nr:hypothetical protein DFJ73DRAFT_531256 [Zopfochytrium polystomum]